jgi:hypothetical protein
MQEHQDVQLQLKNREDEINYLKNAKNKITRQHETLKKAQVSGTSTTATSKKINLEQEDAFAQDFTKSLVRRASSEIQQEAIQHLQLQTSSAAPLPNVI